ncbi:hypothetical protein ElyMa_002244600 [Elysia marginata]|uniref:Uncharacterized protein n=1 Tax=Elysia marginata TaxID=1093978 RepID=A0AAV4FX81_9GAST|nr:hypothetical protein ElyMa_002244600 [Elysia marginata]
MQAVSEGSFPGQSTITFLPMIDMQPTNMSCIYSTLLFASNLAAKHRVNPILTFDQPLWWKAQLILDSEPADSHLRSLMTGSGLRELLEVIYAPDAVVHMLSGKAVARAVRGHLLVDSVLNALLASSAFGVDLQSIVREEIDPARTATEKTREVSALHSEKMEGGDNSYSIRDNINDSSLSSCLQLFDQVLKKEVPAEVVASSQELDWIEAKLAETKSKFLNSRTSRLWLQYMEMLDILRKFIKCERTGNWNLHLHSMKEMLPYLAASGHSLYVKSV